MKIHYLQHVSFEGIGIIYDWATFHKHELSSTKFYENGFALPKTNDFDILLVMGGSMSVYEEEKFDWLKTEKQFIKKAIDAQKIVIGICLGSQLIAEVLGAKVYPNQYKEIGWMPVECTEFAKKESMFSFLPTTFQVFHWHGDTFDLPTNASHLFFSEGCQNQGFIYQNRVLGLQFHLESTPNLLNSMIEEGKSELQPAKYVQNEQEIQEKKEFCLETNKIMKQILDKLIQTNF